MPAPAGDSRRVVSVRPLSLEEVRRSSDEQPQLAVVAQLAPVAGFDRARRCPSTRIDDARVGSRLDLRAARAG